MLHGLGASASGSTQNISSIFKKLDTNSDNSVSRTEFIAGKPDDVSDDQAGSLFDKLNSSGSGSLSQSDLTSAFQQMASAMQSVLLQNQEAQQGGQEEHGGQGGPPDSAEMFKTLDTDSNGTVTREEFVAGRPKNASEDEAGAFFDKIASAAGADSASGLSQDQLASGLKSMGPPDASSSTESSSETSSSVDQLINQILSLLQGTSSSQSTQGGPDSAKMFKDLDKDGDGTVSRSEFTAGRPDDVSEDQASAFYDKIASASGADSASGLSQDQLAEGMKKAGPPDSAQQTSSTQSTTTTQSSSNDQLLQELLKAIGSYQKANLLSTANTSLAA
ncbi:Calsymin [Paramagnetospirillum magnetotacticum MS-1]|uniref:Calsymin n=1 Tax=Paramagnetospirillum magnetotacticum MS-1 TaxID=272627 RepID=A0A0C2YUM5_PARME|nr:EF-hand domain-containing protein [Paramagnetospirillum magnetotacticum]KIL98405.1 Calsymin [Paramagnetospirillum magnetotacticum MS-1]